MKRRHILAIAASLSLLAACKTTEPITVTNSTASASSSKEVRKAIFVAGASKGWVMKDVNNSTIQGTFVKGPHTAIVDISYDKNTYSIQPNSKSSLMNSDGKVDKHLNRWIRNLDSAIRRQILQQNIYDKM